MYTPKTTIPDERTYRVRLLGTGASAPTKQLGSGVTITRTAAGVYKLTFAKNPGTFIGFAWGLGATTPGDVKGHTVTRDTMTDATSAGASAYIEVSLWNASDAADDLQATEYADLAITFGNGASS